jgi:hypothetical protein
MRGILSRTGDVGEPHVAREQPCGYPCHIQYTSLSQSFYPGGTLEIIFRSQGTPA